MSWAGKILRVNLTAGTVKSEPLNMKWAKEYLGSRGLATRYIVEDVPFGLIPLAVLASSAGVSVPLHDAGIVLFSALYGRDFAADNDILPALGLANLAPAEIRARARGLWNQE